MKQLAVILAVVLLPSTLLLASPASPSARRLVAELTDGNEHVPANNRIVNLLVVRGERALVPLRQALLDEDFEGRGYAAWAIAKILVNTGKRPLEMTAALHAAAASDSSYVRTLARSALSLLGQPGVVSADEGPNPWIQAVLRDAPGPDTPPELLVSALPERGGYWPDVICDRLILLGPKSLPALRRAVADEEFTARDAASRTLARLTAALEADGATPERLIASFESGVSARLAVNNALVDRLLLHGKAAIPALTAEISKPDGGAKGYAYWAVAVILRATGERPEQAMKIIKGRWRPTESPRIILGE